VFAIGLNELASGFRVVSVVLGSRAASNVHFEHGNSWRHAAFNLFGVVHVSWH
jgi:hypothetical protein